MAEVSRPRGDARMRMLIADLVAEQYKAYDLPLLADRLGLKAGTDSEAMSSKRKFMNSRLLTLDHDALIEVARELSQDIENQELNNFAFGGSPADGEISSALARFDQTVVHQRWQSALERRKSDPEGAITLTKTLLEDVLKWILTKENILFADKADLPKLYRLASEHLNLAPDAHSEDAFKRILGSCQSVVETIGTLRNRLGDAHSEGPLRAKPKARHAELTVNLAGTMATFLVSTWEAK